jgi:ferric-dicitrate binding protein FerR (iron transport regulator)
MKKATKRTKSGSSSKRAGAKSKLKKTTKAKGSARSTKAKRSAKSQKRLSPKAGANLKRVAKKAAVAAGLAAVGTALSELAPEQKGSEETSTETEPKQGSTSRP